MLDPFVPTSVIKDLNIAVAAVHGDPDLVVKTVKDIAAPMADSHLDLGRALGLKQLHIELHHERHHNAELFLYSEAVEPLESPPYAPGWQWWARMQNPLNSGFRSGRFDPHGSDFYDFIDEAAYIDSLLGIDFSTTPNVIVPDYTARTQVSDINVTLNADEFLLLNLNFLHPLVETKVRFTYGSKTARQSAALTERDTGKLALQSDDKSLWLMKGINLETGLPIWRRAPNPELVAGYLVYRPVLFFWQGTGFNYLDSMFTLRSYYELPTDRPETDERWMGADGISGRKEEGEHTRWGLDIKIDDHDATAPPGKLLEHEASNPDTTLNEFIRLGPFILKGGNNWAALRNWDQNNLSDPVAFYSVGGYVQDNSVPFYDPFAGNLADLHINTGTPILGTSSFTHTDPTAYGRPDYENHLTVLGRDIVKMSWRLRFTT
jgi:hypothetical protein